MIYLLLICFFPCCAEWLPERPITCTFAQNEFAQQGILPVARDIRTIIKTKLLGVQNYELRRSDVWFDRTIIEWKEAIIEQLNNIQAAAHNYAADAQATMQIPILRAKIDIFVEAVNGLAQATQQFYDDRRELGTLTSMCYATLKIAEDLMLEIERSANTIRTAYLPQNVPANDIAISQACNALIGKKDTGWLVRLDDNQSTIPERSAVEREQIPEIFRPHPEVDQQFGDRVIGVNKAG